MLTSTLSVLPGNYTSAIILEIAANEPAIITFSINGGAEQEYSDAITLSEDTLLIYYATNLISGVEPIKSAQYYFDYSSIVYRVNGGAWIDYAIPFEAKQFDVIEAALKFSDGEISEPDIMDYAIAFIQYRISGGSWYRYTTPFETARLTTIEARVAFPDGTYSDIAVMSYNVLDSTNQWIMVA